MCTFLLQPKHCILLHMLSSLLDISQTAKDGGNKLQAPAKAALTEYLKNLDDAGQYEGLFAFFDIKNDFPNEWYKALELPLTTPGRILELGNLKDRLPFYTKNATKIEITDAYIVFNRGFKLSDMNLLYQKVVVPGMGAGEKLGDEMKVTRLADVNKLYKNHQICGL